MYIILWVVSKVVNGLGRTLYPSVRKKVGQTNVASFQINEQPLCPLTPLVVSFQVPNSMLLFVIKIVQSYRLDMKTREKKKQQKEMAWKCLHLLSSFFSLEKKNQKNIAKYIIVIQCITWNSVIFCSCRILR